MKTFVDLSWIRGKAKCVLIDEIKHVADENNFTLKCESFNQFKNANFIYFDTEKKEISDEHFKGVCGSEITLNNALQGKYEPNTTRKDSVEFNGKKYKYVYNEYGTNFSALDCIRCDFRRNNPKDICADILNKIGMNSCKSNFYFKECSPILQNAMNTKLKKRDDYTSQMFMKIREKSIECIQELIQVSACCSKVLRGAEIK